jgi:hypothetical protein
MSLSAPLKTLTNIEGNAEEGAAASSVAASRPASPAVSPAEITGETGQSLTMAISRDFGCSSSVIDGEGAACSAVALAGISCGED